MRATSSTLKMIAIMKTIATNLSTIVVPIRDSLSSMVQQYTFSTTIMKCSTTIVITSRHGGHATQGIGDIQAVQCSVTIENVVRIWKAKRATLQAALVRHGSTPEDRIGLARRLRSTHGETESAMKGIHESHQNFQSLKVVGKDRRAP